MYECPNCGGNLKFDIPSQKLACAYCDARFDPYAISKEKDAQEDHSFEVTVFRCPQCNGEIYSTDNTAAGFCSFCGASTILSSRLKREDKIVGYIIPFRKAKEECKKEYSKLMRKAFFAPKELKKSEFIDSFRGIYMPYWVYYIQQQGPAALRGKKSHRRGDYIITEHYNLMLQMDNYYKGISFDASSSFADAISEKVAPYDVKNMTEFAPTFLSGFYADTSDVDASVYEEDARRFAVEETERFIEKYELTAKYTLEDKDEELERRLNTVTAGVDTAMFPVWFLSYRNGDRVAYATVNGQTGKVAADLPVDIKKYIITSVVMAAGLFFLLNLVLTIQPSLLLSAISLIAMSSALLFSSEMKEIAVKEGFLEDKGALAAIEARRRKREEKRRQEMREAAERMAGEGEDVEALIQEPYAVTQEQAEPVRRKKKKKFTVVEMVVLTLVISTFFGAYPSLLTSQRAGTIVTALALAGTLYAVIRGSGYRKKTGRRGLTGSAWVLLALLIAVVVSLINPVSDLYYYAGILLLLVTVFAVLIELIVNYNILATRRLPQFDYKGGDDRA